MNRPTRFRIAFLTLALGLAALLLAGCGGDSGGSSTPSNPPNSSTMTADSAIDSLGTELDAALSAAFGAPAAPLAGTSGAKPLADKLEAFAQSRAGAPVVSMPMAAATWVFDGTAGTSSIYTCAGGGSITLVGEVTYNDGTSGGVGTFTMSTGTSGLTLTISSCNTGFETLDGSVTVHFNDSISLADDGTYSTFGLNVDESLGGNMTVTPLSGSPVVLAFSSSTTGTMQMVTLNADGSLVSWTFNFSASLTVNGQTCSGHFTQDGGTYGCS